MPSLVPGYEYDVFISYRQNDNRSGWVSTFVEHLREELAATIKDSVNIYFDENPHDGLKDTHQVDKSLEGKLKCLIFVPVLSRTYCDPKSFAWNHEFLAFKRLVQSDPVGLFVSLPNGNVTSRILPIQIHDLDRRDHDLYEKESGGVLRSIDFTFRSQGVNRPLVSDDTRNDNLSKFVYRDQINKIANAIAEVVQAMSTEVLAGSTKSDTGLEARSLSTPISTRWVWTEARRRNVFRAAIAYVLTAVVLQQVLVKAPLLSLDDRMSHLLTWLLAAGFPFALILAWMYEVSPVGIIRTTAPESAGNPFRPSQKKPFTSVWIISALVLFLVVQQILNSLPEGSGPKEKSIAVLPFENRGESVSDEYFADGLTDDLIDNLSIIGDLHVISRGSSKDYKGKGLSYTTIAAELGVATLVIGSFQRNGDVVKISAKLIDGSTSKYIWGNTFQRSVKDIIALQPEIARQIAGVLKIKLNEIEESRLDQRPTKNYTAYDYYLKGRSLYYQYNSDSNDLAVDQFKKAITLDPNFSLAWSGLGDAYSQMHSRFAKGIGWIDSSIVAGSKAVSLDTNSSDAYKALANAYNYARQYDTAFALLKKAVEKNPSNAPAVGNLGSSYFFRLEFAEALRLQKRSAGLNPKNAIPFQIVGWIYRLLDELPEAESWLKTSLSLNPGFWDTYRELAFTYCSQGKNDEALQLLPKLFASVKKDARTLEIAARIAHFAGNRRLARGYFKESIDKNASYKNDPNSLSAIGLGQILLDEGNKVEAEIYLSHALEMNLGQIQKGSQDDDPPFNVAAIYAIQGEKAKSLQWLRKAIDMKWIDYAQVEHGPYFSKFRNDPDFKQVLSGVRQKVATMRESMVKD